MKLLTIFALSIAATTSIAAPTTTTTDLTKTLKTKKSKPWYTLTLEAERAFSRAGEEESYEINGHTTMLKVEPGVRITPKTTATITGQYFIRENDDETRKDKNIDEIGETTLKFLHKTASFKENGIADVRLQARLNYQSSDFFRSFYGNNGDAQFRAYFGRKLGNGLKINKYTTYARYKRYFVNDNAGSRTRNHEFRLRVSPTYQVTKSLETGLTFTYNHIIEVDKDDTEELETTISTRYSFAKGKYAILGLATIPTLASTDQNRLEEVEDKMDQVEYLVNFSAYLF